MSRPDLQSRPASAKDLMAVIRALNEQDAPYFLVGGYALFAHGHHRATEDIDLLVPASREAGKRLVRALLVLPDQAAAGLDLAWFEEGENIRLADEVIVDLLFKTCGETYETLMPYVETVDLDGVPVRTLSLEGLLRTKQSGRPKDIQDRQMLEAALAALRHEPPRRTPGPR